MTDLSVPAPTGSGFRFTIGDAFDRSFSIMSRNLVPFLILSGITVLPYLYFYWQGGSAGLGKNPTPRDAVLLGISVLMAGALGIIGQAVIISATFQNMRGRPIDIGASLSTGLKRFFPIIGLGICEAIGIFLGFIFLIVPGIILSLAWYSAVSACVVERLGPIASLKRSAALTKRNRWQILGIAFILSLVGGGGGAMITGAAAGAHSTPVSAVLQYGWQTVLTAFTAILKVVIYHDLRVSKEGVDTDTIAAVFD